MRNCRGRSRHSQADGEEVNTAVRLTLSLSKNGVFVCVLFACLFVCFS